METFLFYFFASKVISLLKSRFYIECIFFYITTRTVYELLYIILQPYYFYKQITEWITKKH